MEMVEKSRDRWVSLLVQFLSVFLPLMAAVGIWYSSVNSQMAVLTTRMDNVVSSVEKLSTSVDQANLGGLIVQVRLNSERITKLEGKL